MRGKMQVYSKAKITQKMQMYRQLAVDRQKRIWELESLLSESAGIIKSTAMELNCFIDMKNAELELEISCQSETPPDYYDAETVHNAMVFRKEIANALNK